MFSSASLRLIAFCLAAVPALAFAQDQNAQAAPAEPFKPYSGQPGKDVVWVPTPQLAVDKMMELTKVTSKDVVMDLGSGDGRTVITAAKLGARAIGIEYNPDMVALAQKNAEAAGVSRNATFKKADIFETPLDEATVITLFLLPELNQRLRPRILAMKPGTRVASNTFTMGDWQPDVEVNLAEKQRCEENSYCKILYWMVPAKVAGTYRTKLGTVTLTQEYQMLAGSLKKGDNSETIKGKVMGEDIEFTAGGKSYTGRVKDGKLRLRATG